MFFRNFTMFRFPVSMAADFQPREQTRGASFSIEAPIAEEAFANLPLKPVGPLELGSQGFISPLGEDYDNLVHLAGDAAWLALGTEEKLLPAAIVNSALAKRLAEVEAREGRRPGGRARKRIKDELIHDMLPRAFVRSGRTDALVDFGHGVIAVDTSSRRAGESVVAAVRQALGSFPALPVNAEVAPRGVLTAWLAGEPLPEGLSLGDECELRDAADSGATVRCRGQELLGQEIAEHLEAGKQCTRLALVLDDRVSFVLGEDLVLRKVRFLDGAVDQLDGTDREDMHAELDARFALMAGEFSRLFGVLEQALRLSKVEG